MHKLAIGKRQEFVIWARLLKEEIDVYPTLVDDKGIDGIVAFNGKNYEVQIKSGKNWNNQRGLGVETLSVNPNRIYIIFNYTKDEIRYFTAKQILNEPEWAESTKWKIPQIKLPKVLLDKYRDHDWDGLVRYLKKQKKQKKPNKASKRTK